MAKVSPAGAASAARDRLELTFRGIVLGGLITVVFTAANVYLGLKVGLTFASSIPAAVISMAVLRGFRNSTLVENNIVQTIASAAGTLSSVIFVLPGLLMVGWWTGFPFWQSFAVCALGGVLGVMYSVPLRRALVTDSDLPYPEGVAAAEVLKVGAGSRDGAVAGASPAAVAENKLGLVAVVWGSIASAGFAAVEAMQVFADNVSGYLRIGPSATGFGVSTSLALIGAGHLIGLTVGLAMLAGLFIAWGIATPVLSALHPAADKTAQALATGTWRTQVRLIGAGAIGVAAIWTLGRLAGPVYRGVVAALAASRHTLRGAAGELPRTERDIPIQYVALISLVSLLPIAVLLAAFLSGSVLQPLAVPLIAGSLVYITLAGFLVAAACGYMAGLIGSSNSPVSGLAILTVLGASLLLLVLAHDINAQTRPALIAFALLVTAIVLCVATIANDNLQDLKTGQLVDATPWRQQVALIIGVAFGALVIPPILDLLNHSNGFVGAPNAATVAGATALPAPQATLISTLAKGVLGGDLAWNLIGIGALVGAVVVAIDELLRRTLKRAMPPLAVGLGIYLPVTTIAPVVIGAVLGWWLNRDAGATADGERTKRLGVLVASGLIVGESLFNVALAGVVVPTNNPTPLAIPGTENFGVWATILGGLAFAAVIAGLYAWIGRLGRRIA